MLKDIDAIGNDLQFRGCAGRADDPLPRAHRVGRVAQRHAVDAAAREVSPWQRSRQRRKKPRSASRAARRSSRQPRASRRGGGQARPRRREALAGADRERRRRGARRSTASRSAATPWCSPRCRSTRSSPRRTSATCRETHVKRLANAMERVDRFLDPIIAVRKDGKYWTPNGNHRLGASKLLGAKAIIALVLPEEDVAYQILALNTEKAHNLKERSLEVIRMYRGLVGATRGQGVGLRAPLRGARLHHPRRRLREAAPLLRRRLPPGREAAGGLPRRAAAQRRSRSREARARQAARAGRRGGRAWSTRSRTQGFQSPYLKNFVVARVNFLRFKKDGATPTSTPPWTGCWPAPGSSTWTRCDARTLAAWAAGRWSRTRNALDGNTDCRQVPHT